MSQFNNNTYKSLVGDLINDAFYLDARSRRGTISTIRQYTEVIIRKILGLSHEDFVTLGNRNIVSRLEQASNNNHLLLDSLETIRNIGNKCTHTQEINDIEESDVTECIDSLFNIYSYLFISYFEKYKFGKNEEVNSAFSILPPIIRYITLNYLYAEDEINISIIDKLSLAILKAFDKEKSLQWLDERKLSLINMSAVSEEGISAIKEKRGEEVAKHVILNAPENMYVLCVDKVKQVSNIIEQNGVLYDDFENALDLYKSKGIINGDSEEIKEFNSIMDFVYLGRVAVKNNNLELADQYIILN